MAFGFHQKSEFRRPLQLDFMKRNERFFDVKLTVQAEN